MFTATNAQNQLEEELRSIDEIAVSCSSASRPVYFERRLCGNVNTVNALKRYAEAKYAPMTTKGIFEWYMDGVFNVHHVAFIPKSCYTSTAEKEANQKEH